MIIIVDTNVVFSALLNSKSNIGRLILNNYFDVHFISVEFLKHEIDLHWKNYLKFLN